MEGFSCLENMGLTCVLLLWKECDIQEVSYNLVVYIRISKTLSIVVSITNKINNFHRDTRVPLPVILPR
jgi:hypothetical protein